MAQILDDDLRAWIASKVFQNQLANDRLCAELHELLTLWCQAHDKEQVVALSVAVECFLNHLLCSLGGRPLDDLGPPGMGSGSDFALVEETALGGLTIFEVSERGWDVGDACAELTGMFEQLRFYQDWTSLLVDWSAPGMDWHRCHSDTNDLHEVISPFNFLSDLEVFLDNLADTNSNWLRSRTV